MSFRITRVLTVGGCAVAAVAVAMTSAFAAAPTFTVKAGSAASGTAVSFNGSTTGTSPQITFVDTTSNTTLNCASGSIKGTTTTGSGKAGAGIATIMGGSSKFITCTGPFGLQFTVTGSGTWKLNATSKSSTGVNGTVTGIKATVADGTTCNFTAAGSLTGKFVNSTSTLVSPGTTSTLTISNVPSGQCFGAINNGDKASFKATYKLKSPTASQNPITITSP